VPTRRRVDAQERLFQTGELEEMSAGGEPVPVPDRPDPL
jgi:hypothetical protein